MGVKFDSKSNTWSVSYSKRHPLTRIPCSLRRKGIKSQAEAKRIEHMLVIHVEKKLHELIVSKWPVLVERYCKASLEQGMTKKTVDNYHICLKAHTFPAWSERTIDSITTEEIRLLIKDRVGERSVSHQKNLLKFIRRVFVFAVESGDLVRNPTPNMKFKIGDKIKRVLTEAQTKIFLGKAKELEAEWYPHWAMAIYTGMRNGELYALTWDKVNLDNRQILIDCSWNNKDGFKSTKSGDDRMIEIAMPLLTMLKELKLKSYDSNFVLPRVDAWDRGYQATVLRMFLMGIGLSPVRFHDLRATWATIMLSKGVEPIKVMKMGGWKDLKTMMIYARKAGVDIRGMTDCLDLHDPTVRTAQVLNLPV